LTEILCFVIESPTHSPREIIGRKGFSIDSPLARTASNDVVYLNRFFPGVNSVAPTARLFRAQGFLIALQAIRTKGAIHARQGRNTDAIANAECEMWIFCGSRERAARMLFRKRF
jgi:hypothetical protein